MEIQYDRLHANDAVWNLTVMSHCIGFYCSVSSTIALAQSCGSRGVQRFSVVSNKPNEDLLENWGGEYNIYKILKLFAVKPV
jgi:hypothetical protein